MNSFVIALLKTTSFFLKFTGKLFTALLGSYGLHFATIDCHFIWYKIGLICLLSCCFLSAYAGLTQCAVSAVSQGRDELI